MTLSDDAIQTIKGIYQQGRPKLDDIPVGLYWIRRPGTEERWSPARVLLSEDTTLRNKLPRGKKVVQYLGDESAYLLESLIDSRWDIRPMLRPGDERPGLHEAVRKAVNAIVAQTNYRSDGDDRFDQIIMDAIQPFVS